MNNQEYFALDEVEHCIPVFTGDDDVNIKTFVLDFEEVSALCGWSEVRKYIYAKRFIRGTAAALLRIVRPQTWIQIRNELITEFTTTTSTYSLHKKLSKRKIQGGESTKQYSIAMRTIAAQGNISEEDTVKYIVDGIVQNKTEMLFFASAKSFGELRLLLERYNSVYGREHDNQPAVNRATKKSRMRCFNCNALGHFASICNNKNNINGMLSDDHQKNFILHHSIKKPVFSDGITGKLDADLREAHGDCIPRKMDAELQQTVRNISFSTKSTSDCESKLANIERDNADLQRDSFNHSLEMKGTQDNDQPIWSDAINSWRLMPQVSNMHNREDLLYIRHR